MNRSPATDVRPGIRTDIQGLRAVAVLTVVAAHAGVPGLAGGFVGVDVFLVISGFLISQLLFRQIRSGRVRLREFYARRARRILPAATLVTVVTVVVSAFVLAVVDALEVVTDAWWATFFAANVRFADVGTDYFAQDSSESPLQHYWSLAVEEQFYLVWPLLLLVLGVLGRRWRPLPVAAVLVCIGAASFAYGVWATSSDPVAAYFSTPARAWELVVGALTALVAPAATRRSTASRALLALVGLAAIATACVSFGPATPVPGVAVALPVLGTAAVLLAGAHGPDRAGAWPCRLLGVRPLRVVGDWSFSLYLWHWPLLVLPAAATGDALPAWARGTAVAGAFVLAGLTYRYVETPWRRPRAEPRRWAVPRLQPGTPTARGLVLYPVSLCLVAATCVTAAAYGQRGVGDDGERITADPVELAASGIEASADPTVALVQASVVAAWAGQEIPATVSPDLLLGLPDDVPDVSDCNYGFDRERGLCPRGDPAGERTLVVLGSSHGRMWIPAFERIAEHAGYRTYYLVKPSCSAADITSGRPADGGTPWTACDEFRDWAIDQVAELDTDLVVVATTPPGPSVFDDDGASLLQPGRVDKAVEAYARTFDRLDAAADRVVLLRDVPRVEEPVGECLTRRDADLGSCLGKPIPAREELTDASVEAAVSAGVEVVDPRPWLCWVDECPAVIGDHVPYRDQDHLTTSYAEELGDDLGRALGVWRD